MSARKKQAWLATLCVAAAALGIGAPAASGASADPLFVITPTPPKDTVPPPGGYLDGPCGLAVSPFGGNFYVSDYYHQAIDTFATGLGDYGSQPLKASSFAVAHTGPLDDPCGLALDSAGTLYVNNLHRNVTRFPAPLALGSGTVIDGAPLDSERPTGVAVDPASGNVYVDDRTHISVFDAAGNPVLDAGEPLRIGLGSLGEGYGVAVSAYPATAGRIYVPDAATDTVKVYDPALDKVNPVAVIDGHDLPDGAFSSLRDAAIAIDDASGTIYVADNLQPAFTERPQAQIDAFDPAGAFLGHLKYNIVDALPPGLGVDNSANAGQGRVFLTSGNTVAASVYAYGPGSATTAPSVCVPTAVCPPGSAPAAFAGATARPAPSAQRAAAAAPSGAGAGEGAAASEVAQKGNLRVALTGKLSPRKLPRAGAAPIAVSVGWQIATTDQSPPPELKTLQVEVNRKGRFDATGLPSCPYASIQPASTAHALAACRAALVGQGSFDAEVALGSQTPYLTHGRLLVFNGTEHGRAVLYGQIYSSHPLATSFVIVFAVKSHLPGTYGTALKATLPPALRSWGNLTGIQMSLSRRYTYRGQRRSYVSASCPAPKGFDLASFPLARASFAFAGPTQLDSTINGTCKAR